MFTRIWSMMYKEKFREQGLLSLEERGLGQGNWSKLLQLSDGVYREDGAKICPEVHSYRTRS